jgi:hypothetical protein
MSGPVLVQQSARASYPGGGGAGTTATVTLSGVVSGNLIPVTHVAGAAPATGGHAISVSDGTAYTQGFQSAVNYSGSNWAIAACHFLPNAGAGSHVIVGTNNAGAFNCYGWFIAQEWSGMAASPLDVNAIVNTGTSASASSGSTGTLAQASELVVACAATNSGTDTTFSEPSGFTNTDKVTAVATFNGFLGSMDYDIVSVTTALNPTWTLGQSLAWAAGACSFKAALASSLERKTLSANGTRIGGRGLQGGMSASMAA